MSLTEFGVCNRTIWPVSDLRRFSNNKCFLEGFLEGACQGFQERQGPRRIWYGVPFFGSFKQASLPKLLPVPNLLCSILVREGPLG